MWRMGLPFLCGWCELQRRKSPLYRSKEDYYSLVSPRTFQLPSQFVAVSFNSHLLSPSFIFPLPHATIIFHVVVPNPSPSVLSCELLQILLKCSQRFPSFSNYCHSGHGFPFFLQYLVNVITSNVALEMMCSLHILLNEHEFDSHSVSAP